MFTKSDFENVYFHEPENIERYKAYSLLNQEMDAEEVVWRVNNHLDKEKYHFDVPVTDFDDSYMIVNKYFKLPLDYRPHDIVTVDGCPMRKDTAEAYIKMRDAAGAEGFTISVASAYRSAEEQRVMYENRIQKDSLSFADKICARPGYSEHQTGMVVDIQGSIPEPINISKTPEAAWLKENCYKFGFILRYLPEIVEITGYISEPWHLRFVGTDVSMDIKTKGIMSFEEYRERFLKGKN